FGHNDQGASSPWRRNSVAEHKANLRRYVAEVRALNATPLLATSVARRKFDASGAVVETLAEYTAATRAVAVELNVPLIDLDALTRNWLRGLGPEASKSMHMWLAPGRHPALPQGLRDDTHYVEAGAAAVAAMAADALRGMRHPLADWLR
ncbi:MAG: rhamnogalacturonan acetylesterase, partial [Burkholderiales bacterium]|nr:rhamnogalacturonan acetylesterase [Burkholderiales bacterium]